MPSEFVVKMTGVPQVSPMRFRHFSNTIFPTLLDPQNVLAYLRCSLRKSVPDGMMTWKRKKTHHLKKPATLYHKSVSMVT